MTRSTSAIGATHSRFRGFAASHETFAGLTRNREIAKGVVIAAAIALLPSPAFAQNRLPVPCPDKTREQAADAMARGFDVDLSCATTDITVTATRAAQPRDETGQAITVLNMATIEARQTNSVSDLLSTTPGITVSRNGGTGQPTAVRIRGAEDSQTLVLIDGVRVNDPASPGGAFDFGNLLAGNIDRIEVLRGPNSVPWGSQAIGGVVNIVTAPVDGANLRAEYGYKNSKQLVGQAGGRVGIVSASIGGGYFDDDGISAYRDGAERDGYRQYAGNARVGVALSDAVSIDLRGLYADSRVQFDGGFPLGDTANYAKTQQAFGYAGINARTGAVRHRIAFALSDTARDSFTGPGTAPDFVARGRTERFEYQGDATITDGVRAVFGVEHETSRLRGAAARFSTGVTSGYAQAIVTPVARLTLTGGVRVDDHRTYGTKTTLSANAAWRIGTGTTVRASYGEGFKAPTLFQLFDLQLGNPTLAPETARSFDAGVEQSLLSGALKVGVTAFRRDAKSLIGFFDCSGVDPAVVPLCTGRGLFGGYYYNIDRTRTDGIEATIEARPTARLSFTASYALIDAKDRGTGLVLLRRPKHSVNASIDWAGEHVTLGASIQTIGASQDFENKSPFGLVKIDGYTLASVRAAIPVGTHFEFYGRIENLFDNAYETVSGYGTLGRNAHVGVRVKI